ncbi:MAG: metal ABC transporter substrate-binding protein, partial [Chloroflexi bacterium]|nr:metal ABC transporter substrate-binding protein [Chloroflexota bacterium]
MRLSINKNFIKLVGLALLAILATSLAAACSSEPSVSTPSESKARIVTTLYPLEYFAGRIGGAGVDVINLVPPGVEGHDFEPSAADIRAISNADLVLYNGAGFEPWLDRALQSSGSGAI